MKQIRNTNIEVLRLLLMMAIFCWHIVVHGYGFKDMGGFVKLSDEVGIILTSLLAPATYCFMFISGYYGLNFTIKKGITLELWLIIISFITWLFRSYFFDGFSIWGLLTVCFPVSTMKWWFISNYMLIFLMSPILNKGIENLRKNSFLFIVVVMGVIQTISFLRLQSNGGSNFLGLLTIFLLGRYLGIYKIEIKKKTAIALFFSCWLSLVGLMFISDLYFKKYLFVFLNYNTPMIMIMAVSLFYFVKGLKAHYSSMWNRMLQPVLFIYLLTDGLYEPFYKWIVQVLEKDFVIGVLLYMIILVACLLVGHVVIILVNYFLNKIEIRNIEKFVNRQN